MGVKSTEPGQPCPPDLLIPCCVAVHGWGQRGGRRDLRGMMGRGTEGAGTQGLYLTPTLGGHDLVCRMASCFPCSGLTPSIPGSLWATKTEFTLQSDTSHAVLQGHLHHWAE